MNDFNEESKNRISLIPKHYHRSIKCIEKNKCKRRLGRIKVLTFPSFQIAAQLRNKLTQRRLFQTKLLVKINSSN